MQNAAQYIRMSTDGQELSPALQRHAIAEYAKAHSFNVVDTYADEGRSGVRIANRESLQRLLKDVQNAPAFTAVLVYDVSRWGRFQDVDAAAYYEYHCRMNGVQVIYVAESFSSEMTPANVMIKNVKRMMAAECSRDLAAKARAGQERVLAMGFQMGHLPPLGYRRVSVSADGKRRQALQHGMRKLSLTDRVEWVLAPDREVALVQKVCDYFANSKLELRAIAGLLRAEGWLTARGAAIQVPTLRSLLANEALIGNFVWGVTPRTSRILSPASSRFDDAVPRIIDNKTWDQIRNRLHAMGLRPHRVRAVECQPPQPMHDRSKASGDRAVDVRSSPIQKNRKARITHIDELEFVRLRERALMRNLHIAEFGIALAKALTELGLSATFEFTHRNLHLWHATIRIQLVWSDDGLIWKMPRSHAAKTKNATLFVRMASFRNPLDYFLIPARRIAELPTRFGLSAPRGLQKLHVTNGCELTERLRLLR